MASSNSSSIWQPAGVPTWWASIRCMRCFSTTLTQRQGRADCGNDRRALPGEIYGRRGSEPHHPHGADARRRARHLQDFEVGAAVPRRRAWSAASAAHGFLPLQHSHEKALPDEAASVSRLGMTYIHIPVDFEKPTDRDFDQFCSAMEQFKEVPAHVHCIANYRASALFYRYRRDVLGMDEAQARADMEQVWRPNGVWATFVGRLRVGAEGA